MSDANPDSPVTAEQVRQFRLLTDLPWMECKRFLSSLGPEERERQIELMKEHPIGILHDPIEDDPTVRPLFLAVCVQSKQEAEEWHARHIEEVAARSPAVVEIVRSRRGLCHVIWSRIKELMLERHGIDWKSPRELNPWVTFD